MPDDLKIKVTTPGARKAKRDLRGVADAQKKVGKEGEKGGKKLTKGAKDSRQAIDRLGSGIGLNISALANWKLAGVAAALAIAEGIKRSIGYMNEMRKTFRAGYREFVDMTRQAGTVQLAQIRGATEAETVKWMFEKGRKYSITPESAREAAFGIESGLEPGDVGGKAALQEIEQAAFKTMRVGGISGGTAAGLTIAAYESGVARRPEEFKQFFAKATAYAAKSRVSLQQLGEIAARLLPAAVAAGISEDQFLSMAAAMSFRVKDPSRLATSLERMIRAAGTTSVPLEQAATQAGQQLGQMGAVDIMKLQSNIISGAMRAGGPQAAAAMAEQLKLPAELAQVYASAFDPQVQARMGTLMGTGRGARWETQIGQPFGQIYARPETREYVSRLAKRQAELTAGVSQSAYAEIENLAEAEVIRMMGADEDISGVWEGFWGGKDNAIRNRILSLLSTRLYEIYLDAPSEEVRKKADEFRAAIRDAGFQTWGTGEAKVIKAAEFARQHYYGGTHYHQNDKRDPAGRPREPVGKY